jgi:toxin ParE1/3/4
LPRVRRTRRARSDLIEIWQDIARDDEAAADRCLDLIDARARQLVDHPQLGPRREDVRPGLRHLVVEPWVILYRVVDDGIEIVRVVHGRRDLHGLF